MTAAWGKNQGYVTLRLLRSTGEDMAANKTTNQHLGEQLRGHTTSELLITSQGRQEAFNQRTRTSHAMGDVHTASM